MRLKICTIFSILILVFIASSCSVNELRKKRYIKKANFYRSNYGDLNSKSDTVIRKLNKEFGYKNGLLKTVGEIRNNQRYGVWFLFEDSLKLSYILKYKSNRVDTLLCPFVLINYRW